MNMIKKIALTASILLFVLAQAFSCYVIYASHREKTALLKKYGGSLFEKCAQDCWGRISEASYRMPVDGNVVTYYFREVMPEGSALYQGKEEMFNSSKYEFDVSRLSAERQEYPCNSMREDINGRNLQIFYTQYNVARDKGGSPEQYTLLYVTDMTEVYRKTAGLIVQELLVAFFSSVLMEMLLVSLIKKITKPLQAVNETQRQLIGSMSHELKTPLTAIRGYSETLLSVRLSKEQEEKALLYINLESARLSRLSEKMMELTRLYEPECKVALKEIGVETLFAAVEESVGHRLFKKGLSLVLEGDFAGRTKRIDEDLMTSFLINLVNNSVMASKEGGTVYMGADAHSLWVRDEGCGIPKEELDKVRKAFYRVDKSRSRKSGNMGLGLALCEQIAAAHGGRMEILSEFGVGTKVVFTDCLQRDEYLITKKR